MNADNSDWNQVHSESFRAARALSNTQVIEERRAAALPGGSGCFCFDSQIRARVSILQIDIAGNRAKAHYILGLFIIEKELGQETAVMLSGVIVKKLKQPAFT